MGREVTFVRTNLRAKITTDGGINRESSAPEQGAEQERDTVRGDVLLVTCVKT
ncbi:hypothetical protein [Pseudonocardia aurantiaca]|uniref:Uncharacterized protein n=1 Tax=Pseudonocardia aurantiaca TaxID=75290 RepID=A0ABW4FXN8_9PSEU